MANNRPRLYDGDTFDYRGRTFRVEFPPDPDMQEPWKEHDGHGVVSEWTTRDKAPGERVLVQDHHHQRYYDVQASIKVALTDGWGCGDDTHKHTTKREQAACAVDRDYEYLRAWCNDEWQWTYVDVTLLDDDGNPTDERESLGGIDGDHDAGKYLTEVAYELADEILARVEVDTPDAHLSEN